MSAVLDILDLLLSAPGKDIRIVRMLMVNLTIIILFQRMCRTPYRLLEAMKGFLESLETNDASSLQQLCDPLCFTWITQPLSSADHDDYAGYVVFLEALTNHDLFGKTVIQVIEQALPLIGQRMSGNFLRVLSCLHQAFLSFPLDSEELSMHWLAVFLRFHDAIVPLLSAQSSELKKLFIEYDFFQLYLQVSSKAWKCATNNVIQVRISVCLVQTFSLMTACYFPRRGPPGHFLPDELFTSILVGLANAEESSRSAEFIGRNLSPIAQLPSRRVVQSLAAAIDSIPFSARAKLIKFTHPASHHWKVLRQFAALNLDTFENPKSSDPVLCYNAKHIELTAPKTERRMKRKFKVCSRCKVATYCSAQCQVADWAQFHRSECGTFAQTRRDLEKRNVWISHLIKLHALVFTDAFIRLRDAPNPTGRLFTPFTSVVLEKIKMKGSSSTPKNCIFLSSDEPGADRESVLTIQEYVEKYSKWPLWSQERFDALLAMVQDRDARGPEVEANAFPWDGVAELIASLSLRVIYDSLAHGLDGIYL
ncbi:hypothetical protein CC1G_13255 [Coprinopsis cinerea okayama7|uniref:phytol kinase n=1 Tax=Coprinopsis cinerea (strain Okayama-7 / 130 / ATCC MYA-4618 / FGSC 9003) TaxID=240176 RepID=A8PI65_COPC7|nr:hypothetical protein CC1G_13255 [Coprinopsis cinerea okayama7\|eukprot:XP_001841523.2 hypothetical protein CC1G_13255 [Coprinopsis cinerea okayama7\